ncbi:MAG: DNA polymerase III subunit gamma/tau C-terminal domain-containing protein [Thiolinea sp.]
MAEPVPDLADNANEAKSEGLIQPLSTVPAGDTRDSTDAVHDDDNEWHELLPKLKLSGMALQLAEHCLVKQISADKLVLWLETSGSTLKTRMTEAALQDALDSYFGHSMALEFESVENIAETPAQRRIRYREELQKKAEQAIAQDPFVQQLQQQFGGIILPGSVKPNQLNDN